MLKSKGSSLVISSSTSIPEKISEKAETWQKLLHQSFLRNYANEDETAYIQMSNIKRSGDVSMHSIVFQDFLKDDSRYLLFQLAVNDSHLMCDLKSTAKAELCWAMPKSKEHFYFSGRFYIASAPVQVTRYPPPRIISDLQEHSEDYWERERLRQWQRLNSRLRSRFTWPSSGDAPRNDKAFACLHLDALSNDYPNDAKKIIHSIALDNFALLIYKATSVTHFNYEVFPPRRTVYIYNQTVHTWDAIESNP
ncbi:uncharacterized protein VTP21DRAFT_4511 [Calcarisporiella thermophila]|uniref:uncharacterized protein n=1 Tax=Calcarisporiella thermophila TaxID=911321 RepID=UPI003744A8C6